MFSRNSIYPLPSEEGLFPHINGDHDHVSRYKYYYQKDKLVLIGKNHLLQCHT